MENTNFELFTSEIELVESADVANGSPKRAIIKIPVINDGSNSKSLLWKPETMEKIAEQFRGVPFRYDLNGGNEGSHTKDRLSSPFYDVGWTYSGPEGAWYDPVKKCVWVQGEVTHPDVIQKLQRMTSDGRREINFASMGALLSPEDTECSICGKSPFGTCEHQRGEKYGKDTCCMVPKGIKKALHVALTNDPADANAKIADAIFQDMTNVVDATRTGVDSAAKDGPAPVGPQTPLPSDLKEIISQIVTEVFSKQFLQKEEQDMSESTEESEEDKKKKKVAGTERRDVEEKTQRGNPEVVPDEDRKRKFFGQESKEQNEDVTMKPETADDSQESQTQETTTQEAPAAEEKSPAQDQPQERAEEQPETAQAEEATPEAEEPAPVEEAKAEPEAESPAPVAKEEPATEAPANAPSPETADSSIDASTGMANDDTEFSIKGPAQRPDKQKVVTQDSSNQSQMVETADSVYAKKYKDKLVKELADTFVKAGKVETADSAVEKLSGKTIEQLEIFQEAYEGLSFDSKNQASQKAAPRQVLQDNAQSTNKFVDDVPEFGGTQGQTATLPEFQDLSASERREKFGEFGSFDLCFNKQNVHRYIKNK